jgi:plastocyanin
LKRHQGDVSAGEFFALVTSPLAAATVGHPSWRNEPSHVTLRPGQSARVTNRGGRGHTFTEVADFGGGFIPPLNVGLTQAPECNPGGATPPVPLGPGQTIQVAGLAPGLHKFQCCIHPWMRATVRAD